MSAPTTPRLGGADRPLGRRHVRHAACDTSETLATLEWSPRWQLTDGIAALQDWIAQQSDP